MTRAYLDTSAAAKLVIDEPESGALAAWVDDGSVELVAGMLLETELRRMGVRHSIPQLDISALLDHVALYGLTPAVYREAGVLPGRALRTLDALHLACAVRLGVDTVLTYDDRFADAAQSVGIPVTAPV